MGKSSLSKSVLKPKVLVFLDAITSLALFSVTITISRLKPLTWYTTIAIKLGYNHQRKGNHFQSQSFCSKFTLLASYLPKTNTSPEKETKTRFILIFTKSMIFKNIFTLNGWHYGILKCIFLVSNCITDILKSVNKHEVKQKSTKPVNVFQRRWIIFRLDQYVISLPLININQKLL